MTCRAALSWGSAWPTTACVGPLGQGLMPAPPCAGRARRSSLSSDWPSIAARYAALARWSSIGVPSPASTSAAARPSPRSTAGRPAPPRSRARGSGWRPRRRARSGPGARRRRRRRSRSRRRRWRCRRSGAWRSCGTPSTGRAAAGSGRPRDQLARLAHGLPVAGEVVGQRHVPVAVGRGQHDVGLERQQRGRRVADRRAGAEVAADGRAVADQPGGELREHLVEQRHRPVSRRSISVRVSAAPIRISSAPT